jgi:hypothetical protein
MRPPNARITCKLSRCAQMLVCALILWYAVGSGQSFAQSADDARFRETYRRQYEALKGVAPDMVVMELRDRIELVASRGSQVGAASNARRVRSFETALLQNLQRSVCGGPSTSTAQNPSAVIEKIHATASVQNLNMQASDVAELAALAQRLLDGQSRERWCLLKSMDDIR